MSTFWQWTRVGWRYSRNLIAFIFPILLQEFLKTAFASSINPDGEVFTWHVIECPSSTVQTKRSWGIGDALLAHICNGWNGQLPQARLVYTKKYVIYILRHHWDLNSGPRPWYHDAIDRSEMVRLPNLYVFLLTARILLLNFATKVCCHILPDVYVEPGAGLVKCYYYIKNQNC